MDDSVHVRRFHRLGNLFGDRQRLVDRDGALCDAVCERRPLDQLHHQRRRASRSLQAIDRRDVGVIERREDFRFTLEPRQPLRIRRH